MTHILLKYFKKECKLWIIRKSYFILPNFIFNIILSLICEYHTRIVLNYFMTTFLIRVENHRYQSATF